MTTKRNVQLPKEEETVAETDPHTTPAPAEPSKTADADVAEYTLPDGGTYLLTAEEAKTRGAKAVKPANKSVNPSNK